MLKVSLDGGVTWIDAPEGVRIDVEFPEIEKGDGPEHLLFNFTHEGLIADHLMGGDTEVGTASLRYVDLMSDFFYY